MIIPQPKLERIPYKLHGLNYWQQIYYKWHNPPRFRLLENYVVTMDDRLEIIVPKDFIIDGASVPRFLWPIISPTGPLLEGAVLHDFFYQYGYLLARCFSSPTQPNMQSKAMYEVHKDIFGDNFPVFISKPQKFGDQLLKTITVEKHGATVDANRAYWALRLFGHRAFNKYRAMGPGAYNQNSLGLPGLGREGVRF